MARLLIVDDEAKIREVLRLYAEFEGHDCVEAEDGMQAVKLARDNNFDVIIMDVMMPKLDGYYAVKEIRKFSQVPVIMLSARTEEYDRLFGFEVGVDDYVVKPFSPKEVMARVAALLKRVNPGKGATIVSEGLEIDIPGRNVYVDGKKVNMTPKEYELLFYLAQNRGIAISREQLGLTGRRWNDLLQPPYLGILDEDGVDEASVAKCSVDVERKLDALAALKLHAGPGFVQRNIRNGNQVQQVQEKEVRFIFDQDVYSTGKVKVAAVAETLNALHAHSDSVFSDAITTVLHDAMEPEYL